MYKIYINGSLVKITNSIYCVNAIIDSFLNNYIKNTELIIEKNGHIVSEYNHF